MDKIFDRIKAYSNGCINGEIAACKKHKNACLRFLKDAEAMASGKSPYYWDEEAAEEIVKWFSLLRHSKGELAGQPIILTDWQVFHICQLYGWKVKATGRRRFKKMFIECARKNAKSQELAGLALYEVSVVSTKNKEANEVYCAGTKRDQSKIIFNECQLMLNESPLKKFFHITKSAIYHEKTCSFLKALCKDDGKRGDGSNPACLILDEYHQHETTEFYDLAIGSNTKEPLLLIITTAGIDLNVPCYREYKYCAQVLDPDIDIEDDEYLIDICELDQDDYADPRRLKDESLWIKANPIRATYKEGVEKIRTTYEKALKVPEDMPACLTKCFDVWVQAKKNSYMDMKKYNACVIDECPINLKGRQCVIGVDISAKIDLSSIAAIIPYTDDNILDAEGVPVQRYIVFSHSFIPNREKLIERETTDKVPYTAWAEQGFITITDSPIIDQKMIILYAEEWCKEHGLEIACWAVDPHNAAMFETTLLDRGATVYEVYQSYTGLNDATVALREQTYEKNVLYLKNPVLSFAMSNAVVRKNDGRIKIDKDAARQRIDPVDALICCFKYAQTMARDTESQKTITEGIEDFLKSSSW